MDLSKLYIARKLEDQNGFALILTMVMLSVLSILGVMVLNTTDTELKITSNSRSNSDAFIAAELATEYAKQKVIEDPDAISETTNYMLTETDADDDDAGQLVDDAGDAIQGFLPEGTELLITGRNEIDFYTGPAPANMSTTTSTDAYMDNIYRSSATGAAAISGEAAYYRVSVEVRARGKSTARVETVFVNRGGQVF